MSSFDGWAFPPIGGPFLVGMPVRYDAIWEFGFLEEVVGRDKVILQTNFDALLREEGVSVSLVNIKYSTV